MARKSKTQKAKASARRVANKEQAVKDAELEALKAEQPVVEEKKSVLSKVPFMNKKEKEDDSNVDSRTREKLVKRAEKPVEKKKRFQFFRDVKLEMKRVTWPSRKDVIRWSGVVVVALLFFGIYVALLDNAIITPILVAISGIGA